MIPRSWPFKATLLTYARDPSGMVPSVVTEVGSKLVTVTVVETFRYELWIVYEGVKGDRSKNCVVDGTG